MKRDGVVLAERVEDEAVRNDGRGRRAGELDRHLVEPANLPKAAGPEERPRGSVLRQHERVQQLHLVCAAAGLDPVGDRAAETAALRP